MSQLNFWSVATGHDVVSGGVMASSASFWLRYWLRNQHIHG